MSDDLFTSKVATAAVARRLAREASKRNMSIFDRLADALWPVGAELVRRGKLPRAALRPAFAKVVARVRDSAGVLDVREVNYGAQKSDLTVNFGFAARLLVLLAHPEASEAERDFDLASIVLDMDRHRATMRLDDVNAAISPHAAGRFSWRGRRAPGEFFDGIVGALRASYLLCDAAIRHSTGRLAVPHAGGLLLGWVEVLHEPEEGRAFPRITRYDRTGGREETGTRFPSGRDYRLIANLRTFVDGPSLTGVKADLHEALAHWQAEHAQGIEDLSEQMIFGAPLLRWEDDTSRVAARMGAALEAAWALVESPLWARFAQDRANDGG